jgi:hypothetical protein
MIYVCRYVYKTLHYALHCAVYDSEPHDTLAGPGPHQVLPLAVSKHRTAAHLVELLQHAK